MIDEALIRSYKNVHAQLNKLNTELIRVHLEEKKEKEAYKKKIDTDRDDYKQSIVAEFNKKMNKIKDELREVKEDNYRLRLQIDRLRSDRPSRTHSLKSEGSRSTTQSRQVSPQRNAIKRARSPTISPVKASASAVESAKWKTKSLSEEKSGLKNTSLNLLPAKLSPSKSSPVGKLDFPAAKDKVLMYQGKPFVQENYTKSQLNNLPTQYSSDVPDDSIERPKFVPLDKINKPDLGVGSELIFKSSPVRQELVEDVDAYESDQSDISPCKKRLKTIEEKHANSSFNSADISFVRYKTDIIEDSQEEDYEPIAMGHGINKSPRRFDSRDEDKAFGQHTQQGDKRFNASQIDSQTGNSQSQVIETEESQPSSSQPLHDITKEFDEIKNHKPPAWDKPHTALQRKNFLQKYYLMQFEKPGFTIDLDQNPIWERKWILEDFKPNPKYVKPKVSNQRLGIMTNKQRADYNQFYEIVGKKYRLHEDELSYSQIFDKFPSPPGFMQSEFPDTLETEKRRRIVDARQEDRVRRRIASALLSYYQPNKQGEFVFQEDIINRFVVEGRFLRSDRTQSLSGNTKLRSSSEVGL